MKAEAVGTGAAIPARAFIKLIGLNRMSSARDALTLLHSLNDNFLRSITAICSGYSDAEKRVVAQSINRVVTSLRGQDDDLEQRINYLVEASPALTPFYIDPKHRFYTEQQCTTQIGEWSDYAYQGFCETPYPHRRNYIRGHALIYFITGPSVPRDAACKDAELLDWIGANTVELGAHYQLLEEHKVWDREFLEQLLTTASPALTSGIL